MFRDFSESAKTKLLGYVEDVTETSTWGKIKDAIGDAGAHVQSWLGQLNISRYVNDLDKYHKKVLDKNNTTKSRIEEIFTNVNSIDERYDKGFSGELSTSNKIVQFVNHLSETINPGGGNLDMKKMGTILQSDVEAIQESRVTTQSTVEDEMLGTNPEGAATSVDPVNLSTGNFIYEHEDLHIDGEIPMSFHRYYNSKDVRITSVGKSFRHNYEISLEENEDKIDITMSEGQHRYFEKIEDVSYSGINTIAETLEKTDDSFRYGLEDGSQIMFDLSGKIYRMEDHNQKGIDFIYDENNLMIKAMSDNGDYFTYSYNGDGYIEKVEDATGRKVIFDYDNKYLKSARTPEDIFLLYKYATNGRITEIINSQDVISVHNDYDDRFRVTQQNFPDGGIMEFEYNDDLMQVIQTERNGSRTIYVHDDKYRNTEIIYEDNTKELFVYNDRNQCVSRTNRNGYTTRMAYDNRGNMTQVIDSTKRRVNTTYDSNNRLTNISINGKLRLKNSYDKKGNLIYTEDALGNKVETFYNPEGRQEKEIVNGIEERYYSYDAKGNITSISNGLGETITYFYDELNRVIATKDANNNEVTYYYDNANRVIKTVNAEGNSKTYQYNSNGKPIEIVDYDGNTVYMEYDSSGRLVSQTDKEGNTTNYSYDKMWNVSAKKTPDNGVRGYEYDLNNNLVKVVLPQEGEVKYTYDAVGNRITMNNPEDNNTRFEYNSENMLICVTEANGAKTRYEYDLDGNLVQIHDALENTISFTYDDMGNKTSYTDERGYTTYFEYTRNDKVKRIVYPNGGETLYTYDSVGRLKSYREPNGLQEEYSYDANGNLTARKNVLGEKVSFEYDCMNRVVKVINAAGGEKKYTYDKLGNMTSDTDENNRVTTYKYSPNGNLVKVVDPNLFETVYTYDSVGNVKSISKKGNESIQETEFEWDFLGNIKKIKNPLGDIEEYIYDKCGRLLSKIDQDRYETKYHYDCVGEIDEILYADKRKVNFTYNMLKQLESITDWLGTTSIKVDQKGMPLSVTDPYGETVQYEWGSMGEKKKLVYPNGDCVPYIYNNANQLVQMHDGKEKTEYQYDKLGRFIARVMPNGLKTEYKYNEFGRISEITNSSNEEVVESYMYKYDLAGNKIQSIKQRLNKPDDKGMFDYQYDGLNRLTMVSKDGVGQRGYEYDAFGNRILMKDFIHELSTKYIYNTNNQLVSENNGVSENSYGYDRRGNLNKIYKDSKIMKEFIYDSANKMSQVNMSSKSGKTENISYYYNGLGKRIGTKATEDGKWNDVRYTLDLTRKSNNILGRKDSKSQIQQMFYYDGKVMGMKSNDYMAYYMSDDHGSPTILSGDKTMQHFSYDEFGLSPTNDFSEQPFGYTGYQYDDACDMYYAQARMYEPGLGRFSSEDRVRGFIYQPITLNRYTYCCNKPEDFEDDDGEWLSVLIGAAVGAVVSAAVSVTTQVVDGVKSGKSIGESIKSVDPKKVAIEAAKGGIKGAIAGTGMGIVTQAVVGGVVDAGGDIAEQVIVEGKNIKDVDYLKVVETGVVSIGVNLTAGVVTDKAVSAVTKHMGKYVDTTMTAKGEGLIRAIKDLNKRIDGATKKKIINQLSASLKRKAAELKNIVGNYALNEGIKDAIGGVVDWGLDGTGEQSSCGLPV